MSKNNNPYFGGVDRAMMSSKPSIDQQYDSFNDALLQMANQLNNNPRQKSKGFINNLASFAPTFTTGLGTYRNSQKNFEQENEVRNANTIKEQMATQAMQEKRDYRREQSWWKQRQDARAEQHLQNDLAYKNQKLGLQQEKSQQEASKNQGVFLSKSKVYPLSDHEFKEYKTSNSQVAKLYTDLQEVKNKHKELNKLLKTVGVDPDAPYSHNQKIAMVRALKGNITNDPTLRKIDALEKDIQSGMKQINIVVEKAEKGGAATNFLVKYAEQKELFPDVNDSTVIFNKKLNSMGRSIDQGLKAINYSLDQGYAIPATAVRDYENTFGDKTEQIGSSYIPNFFQDEEEAAQNNSVLQPQLQSTLPAQQPIVPDDEYPDLTDEILNGR